MTSLVGVVPGVTEERPGKRHQIRLTGDALSLRAVIFFFLKPGVTSVKVTSVIYTVQKQEKDTLISACSAVLW